jgi:hypothetical protein
MEFTFSGRAKTLTYILMAVGLLAIVFGFITDHTDHHVRFWGNLLINGFFFFAIALGALFFYALQYAAEVGWTAQVARVFEAMYSYLPIGAIVLLVVFAGGTFHLHHLYHWMDPEVIDPNSVKFDSIIANKSAYLNQGFFWVRALVYLAVFLLFARWFRKQSLSQDQKPDVTLHKKMYRRAALFLVFFAVFSSTLSWDWIMSIDTHWYSTLFGWYVFSGMWVTTMIFVTLMVLWLKGKKLLPNVNDSHIHDLGKWMFAISMLWSYLWLSQFLLIWYSNIPEEVTYFVMRIENYRWMFFGMFFINFVIPFYVLIARGAKRSPIFLTIVGAIIFFGHFLDVYLLVVPGTQFGHSHFGLPEVGMFLGFLGLFIFTTLRTLSKVPLVPVNHPFRDESEHHHI